MQPLEYSENSMASQNDTAVQQDEDEIIDILS